MRKYETVFISDPDLQDKAREDLFDKVRDIIASEKGSLLSFSDLGKKRLAYEINKKTRGYYVSMIYEGTEKLIKELERNFRLTDNIMKFMTIRISEKDAQKVLELEEAKEDITAEIETEGNKNV